MSIIALPSRDAVSASFLADMLAKPADRQKRPAAGDFFGGADVAPNKRYLRIHWRYDVILRAFSECEENATNQVEI